MFGCVDLVAVLVACLASLGLGCVMVVLVVDCSFVRLFCF